MGGSEYQKLSGVMNFPSVVSAETQFHRIEKDILIPAILELQAEVIEEALFELKKKEVNKEVLERWKSSSNWTERCHIIKVGIQASYDMLIRDKRLDPGKTDIQIVNTFQSSDRHSDVTPQDLNQRWCIIIPTTIKTLKKTTQRFLRSAVLPLSRRYRTDRVFDRKTLSGTWSTDTMDGRSKSLEGNRYAQVFANKAYFSRIYPMDSKRKAGDALRLFCSEFGVPEKLIFDGSKEQNGKDTEFMRQIRTHDIKYHVSEADLHNQNPVEGVIRELRRKWYRIMIRKRVPEAFWDYGLRWVSEISSMTHSSAGSIEGSIPLTNVTGNSADISEYLDFSFYDELWYKDNAGTSPEEPARWLGVSHRILLCYNVLTQRGTVISRSTVQRVTELGKTTASIKDTFELLGNAPEMNNNLVAFILIEHASFF